MSAPNSNPLHSVFLQPLFLIHILWRIADWLLCTLLFVTHNIKIRELRVKVSKMNDFCCFIKNILEWDWPLFSRTWVMAQNTVIARTSRWLLGRGPPLPSTSLFSISATVHTDSGKWHLGVIMKIVLTSRTSWNSFRNPRVAHNL